jgi:tocopherol O-methyltransferase
METAMEKSMQYYEDNYADYVDGWSKDHIHYGFWNEYTKTHEESLINHTKEVLKHLEPQPGDRVLDAGCGSGGSSRYLVENHDVEAVGVMLSPTLLKAANELSQGIPDAKKPAFYLKDFTDTGFENESFDRIFAVESVCQEPRKERFLDEAYRLLKKGGRLVVADFYLLRNNLSETEYRSYREWCDGWFIPDLASMDDFGRMLAAAGFHSIEYFDKTPLIRKSGFMMYDGAKERLPYVFMAHNEGKLPQSRLAHVIATFRQWECIEWGVWGFGIYVAEK